MNKTFILTQDTNRGIVLTGQVDKSSTGEYRGTVLALVNGRYYSRFGKPVGHDGRMLREDSMNSIKTMLPEAEKRLRDIITEREKIDERLNDAKKTDTIPAPKPEKGNFLDVFQDTFLRTLCDKAAGDIVNDIYPTVEKMIVDKYGVKPVVHEFKIPEKPDYKTDDVLHKDFDLILSLLMEREPVYLYGPAGTGKSYIAQQAAKALNVEYYYSNAITDDVQLKGFIDANGNYHSTQFYDAFTKGGVFLLDELDGSIPEALILLNNALANREFPFPTGKTKAHPDFMVIAAGNTYGTGGDNVYTGRSVLDAASMDRFSVIFVDYDMQIESKLCENDNELVKFAHDFRQAAEKTGIHCLFTYRGIKRLHTMVKFTTVENALRIGLVKGLAADDVRMICNNLLLENSWKAALLNIANNQ